jgi:hypothetical protein
MLCLLNHALSPFVSFCVWDKVSVTLSGLPPTQDPPASTSLSSWDYRPVSPCPAPDILFRLHSFPLFPFIPYPPLSGTVVTRLWEREKKKRENLIEKKVICTLVRRWGLLDLLRLYDSFFVVETGVWIKGFTPAEQALYQLSHSSSPVFSGYCRDGVSWTICMGWLQTMILLISVFQEARFTGVSQQHMAIWQFLKVFLQCRIWNHIHKLHIFS